MTEPCRLAALVVTATVLAAPAQAEFLWETVKYERMVTVKHVIQETTLAWALAEAAKPHLNTVERNDVYMAIGTGETFAAIRHLVEYIRIQSVI